jgi:acetoin utilization deacetylase AcuC-like enzyme
VVSRILNRVQRGWMRRGLAVFHSPLYRLPFPRAELEVGLQSQRSDFARWYLEDREIVPAKAFQVPHAVGWGDLARVHTPAWLDALTHAETLGAVFALPPAEVPVDALLQTARLATGGTLAAARWTLRTKRPVLNLLGGFHHAARNHGGGFCAVNDVAVAVARLRADRAFSGKVVVLDLDAHPPDGTADCLEDDEDRWMGSLSGTSVPVPAWVDETVLAPGTGDADYLAALDRLLARMPRGALAFVLAGGDVLAGDRFGNLGLSLEGVRARDLRVRAALDGTPSAWLAAGGYSRDAWRALAGTAVALALNSRRPIPDTYDPLSAKFRLLSAGLGGNELTDASSEYAEIEEELGIRPARRHTLFLGYYTASGVELAFARFGVLEHLARLGYSDLRISLDDVGPGDRLRVFGTHAEKEHLLAEVVEEKQVLEGRDILFVHWLTLRHPIVPFDAHRPPLPGQDAPGPGLSHEAGEFLLATARRLGLSGVAFRPSWYHMAFTAKAHYRFTDAARQGRFLALVRDVSHLPLREATLAVAQGRVRMNGAPYAWEADVMVQWLDGSADVSAEAGAEATRVHFTVEPGPVG